MQNAKCYVCHGGQVFLVPDLRPAFDFEVRTVKGLIHPVTITGGESDPFAVAHAVDNGVVIQLGSLSIRYAQLRKLMEQAYPARYALNRIMAANLNPTGSPEEWEMFVATGMHRDGLKRLVELGDDATLENVDVFLDAAQPEPVAPEEWRRLAPLIAAAATCLPETREMPIWWCKLASRVEERCSGALEFAYRDLCVAASNSHRPPRVVVDALWFAYAASVYRFTDDRKMHTRKDPVRLAFCKMAERLRQR